MYKRELTGTLTKEVGSPLLHDPRSFSKSVRSKDDVIVMRSWVCLAVHVCFCNWTVCGNGWCCWDDSCCAGTWLCCCCSFGGWLTCSTSVCACWCVVCLSVVPAVGGRLTVVFAPPPEVSSSDELYWRLITAAVPAALSTHTSSL